MQIKKVYKVFESQRILTIKDKYEVKIGKLTKHCGKEPFAGGLLLMAQISTIH